MKSVFLADLKLSINDLVACEKLVPLSFPNETPDSFVLHNNMLPAEPGKNSMPFNDALFNSKLFMRKCFDHSE